jgi:DNA-binding transcriptional regulator LsrR (DeoR family)
MTDHDLTPQQADLLLKAQIAARDVESARDALQDAARYRGWLLRQLLKTGLSQVEVARALKVSESTVSRLLRRGER